MKKILLINYYWPPCGGSAVQRWLDLTANFDKNGIQSYVVTIDEQAATFPLRDSRLKERIASSTEVYTTNTSELFYLYEKLRGAGRSSNSEELSSPVQAKKGWFNKIARFVRGNLLLPDPRKGWNKHAYAQAKLLIQENDFEAVFTAGPPQSTHLIGLQLKKEFPHIKWIADLHDYWTDIFILKDFYRTKVAQYFDRILEKKILKSADNIMVHCQFAKNLYSGRVSGIKDKIFVLTMGYNGCLFEPIKDYELTQKEFVITYTGIMGEQYRPEVFLTALRDLIHRYPEQPIRLRLAGAAYPQFFEMIRYYELENHFDYVGYVTQLESIVLLRQTSLLLLLNPNVKNNKLIVPGKLYEYLAAGKPIVSISQIGSENELIIQRCKAGANFDWNEKDQIVRYLVEMVQKWIDTKNLDLDIQPEVSQYERSYEAKRLMGFLNIY